MTSKKGILTGIGAYLLWGLLPIYWKLLDDISANMILAHRIIWSFTFMILFILFTKNWSRFTKECKRIFYDKKTLLLITLASIIISLNWLVFIWAVNHDHVVQTSLGYYINPLISILLGVFVLKERLTKAQSFSCILAGIAIGYLTWSYGIFPWISLLFAITFAVYGLLKKMANIQAIFSLAIETMLIAPIALLYLFCTFGLSLGFIPQASTSNLLLLLSGVATAIPLLLFGSAVLFMPLTMVGILQYLAPTIMLVIGVFVYKEPFTLAHLITFILIWFSLTVYMMSSLKKRKQVRF